MLTLFVAGCASGSSGSELTVRPQPKALPESAGRTLRLPQGEKFSIALAPSRREPGLDGEAESQSSASNAGHAEAFSRVLRAGVAGASFQLGHAFRNDSDRQQDVSVHVRADYEFDLQADPPGARPDAQVGMTLFARDNLNRLQRSIVLAQHSTADGALGSSGKRDARFTIPLGPGQSLSVYVSGSIEVTTRDGRSAEGTLKLRSLEMDISTDATAKPAAQAADSPSADGAGGVEAP